MSYKSEDEIKKALDIDSWQNLSRDKILQFVAMMPEMDMEVALKIVEQLPEFRKLATEALNTMEKQHESTLASNGQSQKRVHRAFQEVREILGGELAQAGLNWEQKKYIFELLMETAKRESDKDTENKGFLDRLSSKMVLGGVAAAAMAVVFVGGKVVLQGGKILRNLD